MHLRPAFGDGPRLSFGMADRENWPQVEAMARAFLAELTETAA
jgi:hypothetical protein